MNWQQPFNCLYFNIYAVVHKHIETISVIKIQPVVVDRHDFLGNDFLAGGAELMNQARTINTFKKSWPEL